MQKNKNNKSNKSKINNKLKAVKTERIKKKLIRNSNSKAKKNKINGNKKNKKQSKKQYNKLPTELTLKEFQKFFLPYLSLPKRGIIPAPERLHAIFNYILYQLHTGCQWNKLPIKINLV